MRSVVARGVPLSKLLFALGAAMCASACFAITDDVSGLHGPPRLVMRFDDMYQHVNQLLDFKIIDRNNFVHTHGKVLPLKMTDGRFIISVPNAVPVGETGYRVDFWADQNRNLVYNFDHAWEKGQSFALLDHSWRVFLDESAPPDPHAKVTLADGSFDINFSHHLDFVDLWQFPDRQPPRSPPNDTGKDALVHIDNLAVHNGKMAQIRVAELSGHVVGLFRFRGSPQLDWRIEGCVEPGNFYDVDLYLDANDNNDANGYGYDNPANGPGNDFGWRLRRQQADETGLHVTFDATNASTGNVDVGAP